MTKDNENYFLGDCAIVPTPKKDDLVLMTKLISKGVKEIFDIDPYVAMLSFSTNGSGGNKVESVNNVKEASDQLIKDGYNILGETQFDAA
jgi:phosphate acetyltransferase